jgi:uncharacterized protein YpmS
MGTLSRGQWTLLTILALTTLILVGVNISLFQGNVSRQASVNARQQYVQQSIQLEGLNREIIQALANLAARNNDDQLKALLAEHGITFSITQNPSPQAQPAPHTGKK